VTRLLPTEIGDIERAWRWPAGACCALCAAQIVRRPARRRRLGDGDRYYCTLWHAVSAASKERRAVER
jgi:hypothetical protein